MYLNLVLHHFKTSAYCNLTDQGRVCIQSRIRIRNFWELIRGSGSVQKSLESGTLIDTTFLLKIRNRLALILYVVVCAGSV
jgi:hypothetical protein